MFACASVGPGHSLVQICLVEDEVLRPNEKYLRPIKTVASEPCTSDTDMRSLAGAIQVSKSGFGFQRIIRTRGVDPRLLTISEHKVHVIRSGHCSPRITVSQRCF